MPSVTTPSTQIPKSRDTAAIRLPLLRRNGLARIHQLWHAGTPLEVKVASWGEKWQVTAVDDVGGLTLLSLRPWLQENASPWTLALAPHATQSRPVPDDVVARAATEPVYLLDLTDDLPEEQRRTRPRAGSWITADPTPREQRFLSAAPLSSVLLGGPGLVWGAAEYTLAEGFEQGFLAGAYTNELGGRVLRGIAGADPDSDLPAMLGPVAFGVDPDFNEIAGRPVPPIGQLRFSDDIPGIDPSHVEFVSFGPERSSGVRSPFGSVYAERINWLVDPDAAAHPTYERGGNALVAAGLTELLWHAADLEAVESTDSLSETQQQEAARRRADRGWAPVDRYGLEEGELAQASAQVTDQIRALLDRDWGGWGHPLPFEALDTADWSLRFGDENISARWWLGDNAPAVELSRRGELIALERFSRVWGDRSAAVHVAMVGEAAQTAERRR